MNAMSIFAPTMRFYIYIDTSGKLCEVLLFNESGLVAMRNDDTQANHGKVINRFIDEVMTETGIGFGDLGAICVLNGPGSYTGLRISLSTAKGICYAKGLPLVLLNKLNLMHVGVAALNPNQTTACILKARENEYFLQINGPDGKEVEPASLVKGEELRERLNDTKALLFAEQTEIQTEFPGMQVLALKNEHKIALCLESIAAHKFADLFQSEPFYMKNVHINKINKL